MAQIKGVILDFDGLIIDSETADMVAWSEEFARAGVPVSNVEFSEFWHHWSWYRETRMIHRLGQRAGRPLDEEAILARKLSRYTDLCADLPARPGIREWIVEAHELDLRLGVATNDDTGRATAHLARLGLDHYFDAVVTLQPGLARKPAPDLYLLALKILELDPASAVAIEDSSHGVEAAHRAGMLAIAYPTPDLSAHTDMSAADLVVVSAAGITFADVLASL